MKTFNITYEQNGNSFVKGIHVEATSFGEMEEKFNSLNLGTIIGCVVVNQKIMKNDFAIKFNSLEEYREIEKFLEKEGYTNDKDWNEKELLEYQKGFVCINNAIINNDKTELFTIFEDSSLFVEVYNSLEEYKTIKTTRNEFKKY